MTCGGRLAGGRDAPAGNRRHGAATPPEHLRRTAGGLPAAAPGLRSAPAPAATFLPGAPPRGATILPSATILKPAKITGEGATRHT